MENCSTTKCDKNSAAIGPAAEPSLGVSIRKLISNYLVLLGANAIAVSFSFVNTLLLTRWLGPQLYGEWSVFLSIVNGLVLLATNWSLVSLVRYGCEEHTREGVITRAFWGRTILLAASLLVATIGTYLLGGWFQSRFPAFHSAQWFVVGAAGAVAFSLHVQHAFQAVGKMKLVGYVLILERAALLVGIVVLMFAGAFSLRPLMGVFIASGLLAGSSLFLLGRILWLPPRVDGATICGLLSFSAPYLILYPFGFMSTGYIDVLILAKNVPVEDVGIYYLASQLVGLMTQVSTVACTVLIPAITKAAVQGQYTVIEQYLERILPHIAFLWSAALSGILLVGGYVLPLMFGEKFRPALVPFQILVFSCWLAGIGQFAYAAILNIYKWTWANTIIGVSSGLVNLGFDLVLIPILGARGCALATVLACATSVYLMVQLSRKRLALKGGLSIFLSGLPLMTSLVLTMYLGHPWLIAVGFLMVSYFVIRYFRLFSFADLALIREMGHSTAPS